MKDVHDQLFSSSASISRRTALSGMGIGLGCIALNALAAPPASLTNPLSPKTPHFAPRAKNVILLFSSGGVSHLELFAPKPELVKNDGKMVPDELMRHEYVSSLEKSCVDADSTVGILAELFAAAR